MHAKRLVCVQRRLAKRPGGLEDRLCILLLVTDQLELAGLEHVQRAALALLDEGLTLGDCYVVLDCTAELLDGLLAQRSEERHGAHPRDERRRGCGRHLELRVEDFERQHPDGTSLDACHLHGALLEPEEEFVRTERVRWAEDSGELPAAPVDGRGRDAETSLVDHVECIGHGALLVDDLTGLDFAHLRCTQEVAVRLLRLLAHQHRGACCLQPRVRRLRAVPR